MDDPLDRLVEFVDEVFELLTIPDIETMWHHPGIVTGARTISGSGVYPPTVAKMDIDQTETDPPAGPDDENAFHRGHGRGGDRIGSPD